MLSIPVLSRAIAEERGRAVGGHNSRLIAEEITVGGLERRTRPQFTANHRGNHGQKNKFLMPHGILKNEYSKIINNIRKCRVVLKDYIFVHVVVLACH